MGGTSVVQGREAQDTWLTPNILEGHQPSRAEKFETPDRLPELWAGHQSSRAENFKTHGQLPTSWAGHQSSRTERFKTPGRRPTSLGEIVVQDREFQEVHVNAQLQSTFTVILKKYQASFTSITNNTIVHAEPQSNLECSMLNQRSSIIDCLVSWR